MLNKKWGIKPIITLGVIVGVVASFVIHYPTYANESFFTRNHIIFYDKNDTHKLCSGIGTIGNFSDLTLTEAGVAWFKGQDEYLKKKLSEVIQVNGESKTRQERYIMAATKLGLPADMWKIMTALDYYERGFGTTHSIHNGSNRIGTNDNIDNTQAGTDYQDDLVQGLNHFLEKARQAKFDPKNTSDWTLDKVADSFLRWNRGSGYHSVNWTWHDSGYVNNFSPDYKYQGKLDRTDACKIPSLKNDGLICDLPNSKPGIIHIFNFINNNFSLSPNAGGASGDSFGNMDCSSSMDSLANLNGVAAKIMAVYQQYAYPEYHAPGTEEAKRPKDPTYQTDPIIVKYGGFNGGQDCGAWVRFVVIKSGLDPNYGGGYGSTDNMQKWLINPANGWQKITPHPNFKDISQFQPGDVGLCNGHTYLYIGDGIFSSARLNARFPMRSGGEECVGMGNYNWWRKVK